MKRQPRVFLGLIEIAGYYSGLHDALHDQGIEACVVDLGRHPFRYRAENADDPVVARIVRRVRDLRPSASAGIATRFLWRSAWFGARVLLFAWAAVRFDVFVLSTGQSFLRWRDLPLLHRLGKRLIFVFHGSEARPAYIDGQKMTPERALSIPECIAAARRQKAMIRRIERYADVIVAQPAFSHFFERRVVNWFVVGVPWREWVPAVTDERAAQSTLRIVHSPSDPPIKGSGRIRDAITRLRSEGLDLELIELRGVPNDVVLAELARCDFAIDQLYSDAPMVGFATEAAVASKPAIVGGYAWEANRLAFGAMPFPPVEECSPDGLIEAIRRLATDAEHRERLGSAASAFVHEHWSGKQLADRMVRLMEGPPPEEWLFDPASLRYTEGCGLTREEARHVVAEVIRVGGRGALCLADKPEVEEAFVAFARTALDAGPPT